MNSRLARGSLFLLACALCACATYHPAPLEPAETAHEFGQRSLANPALCAYLKENLGDRYGPCPPADWSLPALTLTGFFYNPKLAVARAKLDVARAGIITAGERPNPSIGIGPAYTASASPSFAPWAIGVFQFNFPIETAGRRGYRIARAQHLADASALAVGQIAWQVRSAVRMALLNHLMAERESKLAQAYESASQNTVEFLRQRVSAGYAAAPTLNFALAYLAAARVKAARAQSRVPETLNVLAAALGVPVERLEGAKFVWPDLEHPPSEASLTAARVQQMALLNRIDLRRMLETYAAADENLKLQIARQYPDINLGGGYAWEVNENIFELFPVVSLPLMNQNQGPIAEARARRVQVAAQFAALQDSIIAQANGALIAYRGALGAYEQGVKAVAYAQKRLSATRRAAELGDVGALTVATDRLATITAEQSRTRALADAQRALGSLENAIERPLEQGGLQSFTLPASHLRKRSRTSG